MKNTTLITLLLTLSMFVSAQNNEFLFDSGLDSWAALPNTGNVNNGNGTITFVTGNSNFARIENPNATFNTANVYLHIRLKNLSDKHDKLLVNSHGGGAKGSIAISKSDTEFKEYVITLSAWGTGTGHRFYPKVTATNKSVGGESMIIDYIIYSNSNTIDTPDEPEEETYTPVDDPYVGTYLPYYRINSVSSKIFDHLTHLFYFSFGPDIDGELGRINNVGTFTHINNIASVQSNINTLKSWRGDKTTKIFITIGGWIQSDYLDEVAANPIARVNLAQKAKDFCIVNNLDGIDIDWEGYHGAVNGTNYGLLLAAIKSAISGTELELSVTVGDTHTSLADKFSQADFVQLMSYGKKFGEGTQVPISMLQGTVNNWVNAGINRANLVIGLPSFAKNSANEAIIYKDIIQNHNPTPEMDMVVENDKSYYFNGVNTIKEKAQFAIDKGLRGVMFWEQGQDVDITHEKSLLNAATEIISINTTALAVNNYNLKENIINVYPNPFTTEINLTVKIQNYSITNAEIYNQNGQLVWKKESFQSNGLQKITIDLTKIRSGIYVLKISDGKHIYTKKLIKM